MESTLQPRSSILNQLYPCFTENVNIVSDSFTPEQLVFTNTSYHDTFEALRLIIHYVINEGTSTLRFRNVQMTGCK